MSACAFNRRILSGHFPVTQSRENDAPQAPDIEKVAADISGHAMTSALRTVIRDRRFSSVQETITFLLEQNLDFPGEVRRASEDRFTAIRGSFFRICGIAQSMHKIVKALDCGEAGQKAAAALGNIACYFAPEKWCVLEEKVSANLTPQLMHQRLSDYPALCRAYAELQYEWTDWIKQERRKTLFICFPQGLRRKTIPLFGGKAERGRFLRTENSCIRYCIVGMREKTLQMQTFYSHWSISGNRMNHSTLFSARKKTAVI